LSVFSKAPSGHSNPFKYGKNTTLKKLINGVSPNWFTVLWNSTENLRQSYYYNDEILSAINAGLHIPCAVLALK
jgi:hypothetical protein